MNAIHVLVIYLAYVYHKLFLKKFLFNHDFVVPTYYQTDFLRGWIS